MNDKRGGAKGLVSSQMVKKAIKLLNSDNFVQLKELMAEELMIFKRRSFQIAFAERLYECCEHYRDNITNCTSITNYRERYSIEYTRLKELVLQLQYARHNSGCDTNDSLLLYDAICILVIMLSSPIINFQSIKLGPEILCRSLVEEANSQGKGIAVKFNQVMPPYYSAMLHNEELMTAANKKCDIVFGDFYIKNVADGTYLPVVDSVRPLIRSYASSCQYRDVFGHPITENNVEDFMLLNPFSDSAVRHMDTPLPDGNSGDIEPTPCRILSVSERCCWIKVELNDSKRSIIVIPNYMMLPHDYLVIPLHRALFFLATSSDNKKMRETLFAKESFRHVFWLASAFMRETVVYPMLASTSSRLVLAFLPTVVEICPRPQFAVLLDNITFYLTSLATTDAVHNFEKCLVLKCFTEGARFAAYIPPTISRLLISMKETIREGGVIGRMWALIFEVHRRCGLRSFADCWPTHHAETAAALTHLLQQVTDSVQVALRNLGLDENTSDADDELRRLIRAELAQPDAIGRTTNEELRSPRNRFCMPIRGKHQIDQRVNKNNLTPKQKHCDHERLQRIVMEQTAMKRRLRLRRSLPPNKDDRPDFDEILSGSLLDELLKLERQLPPGSADLSVVDSVWPTRKDRTHTLTTIPTYQYLHGRAVTWLRESDDCEIYTDNIATTLSTEVLSRSLSAFANSHKQGSIFIGMKVDNQKMDQYVANGITGERLLRMGKPCRVDGVYLDVPLLQALLHFLKQKFGSFVEPRHWLLRLYAELKLYYDPRKVEDGECIISRDILCEFSGRYVIEIQFVERPFTTRQLILMPITTLINDGQQETKKQNYYKRIGLQNIQYTIDACYTEYVNLWIEEYGKQYLKRLEELGVSAENHGSKLLTISVK